MHLLLNLLYFIFYALHIFGQPYIYIIYIYYIYIFIYIYISKKYCGNFYIIHYISKYFEYDSDGQNVIIINKELLLSDKFSNKEHSIEFEKHKNLFVLRASTEYEFELGESWALFPSFNYDFKEEYSTWSINIGVSKRL